MSVQHLNEPTTRPARAAPIREQRERHVVRRPAPRLRVQRVQRRSAAKEGSMDAGAGAPLPATAAATAPPPATAAATAPSPSSEAIHDANSNRLYAMSKRLQGHFPHGAHRGSRCRELAAAAVYWTRSATPPPRLPALSRSASHQLLHAQARHGRPPHRRHDHRGCAGDGGGEEAS